MCLVLYWRRLIVVDVVVVVAGNSGSDIMQQQIDMDRSDLASLMNDVKALENFSCRIPTGTTSISIPIPPAKPKPKTVSLLRCG